MNVSDIQCILDEEGDEAIYVDGFLYEIDGGNIRAIDLIAASAESHVRLLPQIVIDRRPHSGWTESLDDLLEIVVVV